MFIHSYEVLQITPDFTPDIWSIWSTSPRGTREARKGQREKREQDEREIRILVLVTRYKYLGASLYVCT
jgi:hypothetical protein